MFYSPPNRRDSGAGFTLVEMLVAMAITLIMMAAVARAFAFVSTQVRSSRVAIEMSSDLRDIVTRMEDELSRCTVSLQPATSTEDQDGYFLYYEGPCTKATSTLFGAQTTLDGITVAASNRYGDIDDYIAFTAVASPGSWFTGQVPEYVLTGTAADTALTTIKSRYAEIVYFTHPERDSSGAVIDTDGDLLPDRLLLYRRVLLIRPDLNTSGSLGLLPAVTTDWQLGMTAVHQVCDLSLTRALNTNGTTSTTLRANSLADLTEPHNRFAHVRAPSTVVTGIPTGTTMPILALEPPMGMITNATATTLRPVNNSVGTSPVILESRWSGYLRREFRLTGVRQGQDVIANNCRAFDIQIYDDQARFLLTSNNLVVAPNDPGYREALEEDPSTAIDVPGGGFVDLCYPVLAGGPLRGWQARELASSFPGNNVVVTNNTANREGIQTRFSGLDFFGATAFPTTATARTYSEPLLRSGRVILASNQVQLFQPAFDTYTAKYEQDGYYQNRRYSTGASAFLGTTWPSTTTTVDFIDLGSDGVDTPSTATVPLPGLAGTDDPSENETSAPFPNKPSAIRVTVRLENVDDRQLRESSLVHSGR